MAKCKILMQTAQVQKLITYFDGYKDDKVDLKYVSKAGIKATFECETELFTWIVVRKFCGSTRNLSPDITNENSNMTAILDTKCALSVW